MITLMMIQVRKAYDMEEDDETGRENFRIKATFFYPYVVMFMLWIKRSSWSLCFDSTVIHTGRIGWKAGRKNKVLRGQTSSGGIILIHIIIFHAIINTKFNTFFCIILRCNDYHSSGSIFDARPGLLGHDGWKICWSGSKQPCGQGHISSITNTILINITILKTILLPISQDLSIFKIIPQPPYQWKFEKVKVKC